MAFQNLALGQILYAAISRTHAVNPAQEQTRPNPYFKAAFFGSLALQLGGMLIPGLRPWSA
jgi:hypothetical protein